MKRSSYGNRDYTFGQAILTLRTRIGLTQTALANYLEVSRYAVAEWEAGSKYPTLAHLKALITVAFQHRGFPAGHETQEIHSLWRAAHAKVPLDALWLAGLLAAQPVEEMRSTTHAPVLPVDGPRVDWGTALSVPTFYGRERDLNQLTEWVVEARCRVVNVLGMGGIGKSALSVRLMYQVAGHFEVVIWRSVRDSPACEWLLDGCLQVLAPQVPSESPASLERRISLLLEYMRSTRVLLVLDNLETVLEENEGTDRIRPEHDGYRQMVRQIAETEHQSCLLFTSREKPGDLVPLEGDRSPVRVLRLGRLEMDACTALLAEKKVTGTILEQARLIEAYAGNPLALKIVAQTIADLFDGQIGPFLEQGELVFGGIRHLLNEQFARLSALEQRVLIWLAIIREPATLNELMGVLVTSIPRARMLEAVEALHRHSLIDRGQEPGSFTLQSVVMEYVTTRLVSEAASEIEQGRLARLIEHGLELAPAREYVRQTQERLIVAPILAQLRGVYSPQFVVADQLRVLLKQLTAWADDAQGYGPANLVALLRLQRDDLRGLDLSRLVLRSVYLQGIEMQDATLSHTMIQDGVITQPFGAIMSLAISSSGTYWAASSRHGEVRVWEAGGLILHRGWQAHTDMIWTLAFSPDGNTLASGSWDGTVKLWDVATGALLWTSIRTARINRVVFAPDGSMLATGGGDGTVRLWDMESGAQLLTLPHSGAILGLTWSPDGRLLASSDVGALIRLWEVQKTGSAVCVQTLTGHTTSVHGLAFTPDSTTLASVSYDATIELWDVVSGQLRETLTGHTDRMHRVAWSPDGRTLATGSPDRTIWLWDVEQGRCRAVLHGHTASVDGLAFMPDNRSLLSGSEDGMLRLWDVQNGDCLRIIQGYSASLNSIDWSPDGTQLVTGSSDTLVTLFDVTGRTAPRILRGHSGIVFGVGWSADGRRLATGEWGNSICIWDPISGDCLEAIRHPQDSGNLFFGLAWSPDGQRLAIGTYRHGVQVVGMMEEHPRWAERHFPTLIGPTAWSPDGAQLAGGGGDGTVYVWDSAEGTLLQRLAGHHGEVRSLAWSPNGTQLASGSGGMEGGELFVWDVQRGELVGSAAGHRRLVRAVTWGSRSELLVSGDGDGTLRCWDVQRGESVWVREAHQGAVQSLRRSPDGTKLASCGDDGAIMLWDLHSGEYLQTLRRDRPYERLNITGIRGLTEAQKVTLRALGAIEELLA